MRFEIPSSTVAAIGETDVPAWMGDWVLKADAKSLAKAHPGLGLYDSLAAARAEKHWERRHSAISKVLHRKRPDLVPLYDSRIDAGYRASGYIAHDPHRSWVDFMNLLCRLMRDDLQRESLCERDQ